MTARAEEAERQAAVARERQHDAERAHDEIRSRLAAAEAVVEAARCLVADWTYVARRPDLAQHRRVREALREYDRQKG